MSGLPDRGTLDDLDGDPEVLADSIANALAGIGIERGFSRSFALVLDDAHVAPPEVLKNAVRGILSRLPEGTQPAVASRCEPALALGRMHAQRMLVEIHAKDLSMSAVEAMSLLRKAGLDLDLTAVPASFGGRKAGPQRSNWRRSRVRNGLSSRSTLCSSATTTI